MTGEKFNIWRRILALANIPKSGTSVLDWHPFVGGASLAEIVKDHNEWFIKFLHDDLNWLEEHIKIYGQGVAVDPRDLSRLDQLRIDDLKNIHIIMIDLEAFDEEKRAHEAELRDLKSRMEQAKKKYLIVQVSQKSNHTSQLPYFAPMPVIPCSPLILLNQKDFERFLTDYSKYYGEAADEIRRMDWEKEAMLSDRHTAKAEFRDALPKIAAEVSGEAYSRRLHEWQTGSLARKAAIQEAALINLSEKIDAASLGQISLDSLRQPLNQMPVEPLLLEPQLQEVQLVKLTLSPPWIELTENQSEIIMSLGIKPGVNAAFHLNEPQLWGDVRKLGNVIQTEKFTAKLPRWSLK